MGLGVGVSPRSKWQKPEPQSGDTGLRHSLFRPTRDLLFAFFSSLLGRDSAAAAR